MNCEFCKKPLHFSHHENNKEIEVYDCNNCPVLTSFYYFHEDGDCAKVTFMLDKNERGYMWTNNYIKNISYITDLGNSTSGKDPLILKFPKIMNVNPDNIYDKFKFYMVFL
jgi:ssDNA-binding Zn-finger/Zn-ribbon topoisomerase 1